MNKADLEILARTASPELIIYELIRLMGDDPNRLGLLDTPKRVINSYKELFSGYKVDVERLLTTFEDNGNYNGIVLCRDIEFTSFCEHHLLPFSGVAHVAYIPFQEWGKDGKLETKVVGLSKLARVVDAYSRRLQMQERIGQQVVNALNTWLKAKGSACILEAKHLCMSCRGVRKQHSSMITSSLAGCFLEEPSARAELLSLIKL